MCWLLFSLSAPWPTGNVGLQVFVSILLIIKRWKNRTKASWYHLWHLLSAELEVDGSCWAEAGMPGTPHTSQQGRRARPTLSCEILLLSYYLEAQVGWKKLGYIKTSHVEATPRTTVNAARWTLLGTSNGELSQNVTYWWMTPRSVQMPAGSFFSWWRQVSKTASAMTELRELLALWALSFSLFGWTLFSDKAGHPPSALTHCLRCFLKSIL